MAIDIKTVEIKSLKIDDLIADATERKDVEALKWLLAESKSKVSRKKANGEEYQVSKSIVEIRSGYFRTFLNYKPESELAKERARELARQKKEKELDDKFAKAFAELGLEL